MKVGQKCLDTDEGMLTGVTVGTCICRGSGGEV